MRRRLERGSVVGMNVRGWVDRWGDGIVALALGAGTELEFFGRAPASMTVSGGRLLLTLLLAFATLPLVWRRRMPAVTALTIVGALVIASLLVTRWHGVPVEVFLALILAFYSVGAHCDERRAVIVGGGSLAALAAVDLARQGFFNGSGSPRPAAWLVFAMAWLVGREVRRRRRELELLRDRAAQLERERETKARMAAAEERGRIARELHDVIAHSVSVMVVQAQAGPRQVDDRELVLGAFRSIEVSGREALVELRRLLGVLRTGDERPAVVPQPGLGSLQSLVEQVRRAGLPVEFRVEGTPTPLPPGVDLSAYRIVQEALTNTLKHGGQAAAEVVVRYEAGALEVEVVDNGAGSQAGGNGTGHGLIGMRERVALHGGMLEAGARGDRGYAVRARLPLEGAGRA